MREKKRKNKKEKRLEELSLGGEQVMGEGGGCA
jgi:hypothetical protein